MSTHRIATSVISLANPWLDFLPSDEALAAASEINQDLEAICADSNERLYAFGTLPITANPVDVVSEIYRLDGLPHIRGVILGTAGRGTGLDDPALEPIWDVLGKTQLLIFLHPHYGLSNDVFGPRAQEYGHVLPLSLGFPMETTIAFVRMWLSGVFDRHQGLRILVAHAGGTVPFLAGRLESCVEHERRFRDEHGNQMDRKSLWCILKENVWLDAVAYSKIGVQAAIDAVGEDRVLFGTDHPFFPPMDDGAKEWVSAKANINAVNEALCGNHEAVAGVLGRNAIDLLRLETADSTKR
jgi:predicted TIM-barrel fold metal-dependent hydrolase